MIIPVTVTKTYEFVVKQNASGYWEAWSGELGSTTARTKEECIRIMKERAQESQ